MRHFVADLSEAARLGLVPGEHYFCVSSIRVDRQHDGAPLCWTDVYAQRDYTAVIELAREHPDQLIAGLIEQHYGRAIAVVDQQVRAVLLTAEMARALKAEAGSPGLKIIRHYREENGDLMAVSRPCTRMTALPWSPRCAATAPRLNPLVQGWCNFQPMNRPLPLKRPQLPFSFDQLPRPRRAHPVIACQPGVDRR